MLTPNGPLAKSEDSAGALRREPGVRRRSASRAAKQLKAPFARLFFTLLTLRFGLDRLIADAILPLGSAKITIGVFFNLVFFTILIIFTLYTLIVRRSFHKDLLMAYGLWLPLLISTGAAVMYSGDFAGAFKYFWNIITYFGVFYIGVFYARYINLIDFVRINIIIGIPTVVLSLFYLFQDGFGVRMKGVAGHPNILAFYLFFYVSFCYHSLVWGWVKSNSLRAAAIVFGLIGTVELLLTGTRSAFIALYVFLVITSFKRPILLAIILPAPLLALAIPSVADRLFEVLHSEAPISYEYAVALAKGQIESDVRFAADSGTWRMFLWKAAWPVIMKAPVFGHGIGMFQIDSPNFFGLGFGSGVGAHNIYVQILYEQGFVGLISYLFLIAGTLLLALFNFRNNPGLAIFVIIIDLSFNIASFSDNMLYYLIDQIYIWFAIGFVLASLLRRKSG